jgi:hypothetical protein
LVIKGEALRYKMIPVIKRATSTMNVPITECHNPSPTLKVSKYKGRSGRCVKKSKPQ